MNHYSKEMLRKRAIAGIVALFLALPLAAKSTQPEEQIRALLNSQVAAWNRGDLEGFMAGYWKSPQLVFQSGAQQTRGWQPTLERYRRRYQQGGNEMGKLAFENLEIVMLGTRAALVRGGFRLSMRNGAQPHGLFTLILRKFPEGWRIIHDHTCAAN